MKKIVSLLLAVMMVLSLVACGGNDTKTDNDIGSSATQNQTDVTDTSSTEQSTDTFSTTSKPSTSTTTTKPETSTEPAMTEDKLLSQIDAQELKVVKTKYVVQDEEYKSLYPDMLQAVIQNDTSYDIKNALVAFVAWDSNNLPVKIKGSIDFSDGSYIQEVNYGDINLVPGKKFGESNGFAIDENCNIKTFKAIVVSYETFDGTTWENPLYEDWCEFYEGVKLQ